MNYHPKYCTLAYGISCLLDAVDGQAARALGQTSKFGAVLDMVTDRCVHLAIHIRSLCILTCLSVKVYNLVPSVLFSFSLPRRGTPLPISHRSGLCKSLHAHVQVRVTFLRSPGTQRV